MISVCVCACVRVCMCVCLGWRVNLIRWRFVHTYVSGNKILKLNLDKIIVHLHTKILLYSIHMYTCIYMGRKLDH